MSPLSLDLLRTFLAVHRTGSITAAAQTLGLSQPAVTAQVKALESALDRPLFDRLARGVAPTPAADELARRVAVSLDALDEVVESELPTDAAVQLGGPAEFLCEVVMPMLAPLVREGLRLRTTLGLADDLLADLAGGRLDLVLSTIRPRVRGVQADPLYDEEFLLVAAPSVAAALGVVPASPLPEPKPGPEPGPRPEPGPELEPWPVTGAAAARNPGATPPRWSAGRKPPQATRAGAAAGAPLTTGTDRRTTTAAVSAADGAEGAPPTTAGDLAEGADEPGTPPSGSRAREADGPGTPPGGGGGGALVGGVGPKALAGVPLVAYAEDLPIVRRYWRTVFGRRPAMAAQVVIPDLRGVLSAVKAGMGVSVLPAYLCRRDLAAGALVTLADPEEPPINTGYLAVRSGAQARPAVARVRAHLLEAFRADPLY
ncbi:LysR substrate-binding domain-containing protein [Nonomuraea sp. SYSU D8015]|uniref:LysR substrate-binding domain-containing protein n=1 Tax=Nonomuraea sp. SYSU D8015 TaxID=2593644 RepID=UPI00300CF1F9